MLIYLHSSNKHIPATEAQKAMGKDKYTTYSRQRNRIKHKENIPILDYWMNMQR